jgi:hypothetical protein
MLSYYLACWSACRAVHLLEETVFGLYELLPYINWIDRLSDRQDVMR